MTLIVFKYVNIILYIDGRKNHIKLRNFLDFLLSKMSIFITHPDIAKEWHPTKNGVLKPENISFGSDKKVWWLCPNKCSHGCPHEWETAIKIRCRLNCGCVYCSNPVRPLNISNRQ